MRKFVAILLLFPSLLEGCATDGDADQRWNSLMEGVGKNNALQHGSAPATRVVKSDQAVAGSGSVAIGGTGTFINTATASISHEVSKTGGDLYTLNLVEAPISEAAKKVLGDIMQYNYLVDPRVQGKITLETSNPVSKEALLSILETSLAVNHAAIVQRGGRYDIVPETDAIKAANLDTGSLDAMGPGLRLQVIPLRYISAEEMKNILIPITKRGAILRVDNSRNYLIVAGNGAELSAMREAVSVFDVDYMRGMSVGLYPLKTAKPGDLVNELANIFASDGKGSTKLIRFIPNNRLNSVMAITSRQDYLPKVAAWIRKLDRIAETNDEQMFVYPIQNRPAQELATILQSVLSTGSTASNGTSVAPNLTPATYAAEGSDDATASQAADQRAATTSDAVSAVPKVVADVENNALLISTTAREYRRIEQILQQLDVVPTQVFLEAVIAEVTLNDQLKYGMNWYFEQGHDAFSLSDVSSGKPVSSFPGFSWTHSTNDIQAALNTISSVTKVKIISSPNLMVINNQKATLQVGDQVPIVTQTSTSTTTNNSAIVNSVELKDTGIILSVTPRINTSGRVMLDIDQEVSDVVQTTTSGIDSPTIQQRKISTRVVVSDGESIALGGLIQEKKSRTEKKLPIFGDVPVLGNAFKSKTDALSRTELIIFIRPRVVRNVDESRQVTEEFRGRMDFGRSDTPANRIKQDFRRLVQ